MTMRAKSRLNLVVAKPACDGGGGDQDDHGDHAVAGCHGVCEGVDGLGVDDCSELLCGAECLGGGVGVFLLGVHEEQCKQAEEGGCHPDCPDP